MVRMDDYRRRLDEAGEISTADEASLLLKGALTGTGFAPLNARQDIQLAKQDALRRARKEMLRAIREEDDRVQRRDHSDRRAGNRHRVFRRDCQGPLMRIVFRYLAMQDVVDFALATLREKSLVGAIGDQHPGLYRDSHMVFLNGNVVADGNVSARSR
jgi:hypothetical protein